MSSISAQQQPAQITQPAQPQPWEKGKGIYHPAPPQCFNCKHLRGWQGKWGQYGCKAYGLIPGPIINNLVDHRQSQPGDQGITWAPQTHKGQITQHPLDNPVYKNQ